MDRHFWADVAVQRPVGAEAAPGAEEIVSSRTYDRRL